jgi:YVTN family beta-propeller protein
MPEKCRIRIFHNCASALALAILSASAQATPNAYVANERDGSVSVIDTQRDEVVRTLSVLGKGSGKLQAAIADHGEKTLFVVDALSSTLIAVDLASGQVKARIAVGKTPEGASLAPSGKQIAVCGEDDNSVTLVDVATGKATRTLATQGKNPEHCVFSANEHWLLTSNENSNDVDIIDLAAGKSIALVATSGHPRGIAILPGDRLAYVVQETSGGIDAIDLTQHKVVKSIATGLRPADAIASPDGHRVYVSNGGAGTIAVIDVAAGKVVANIPVGKRAWNMALTHDGKKLYVANGRSDSVSVIDTVALKPLKDIAVGGLPWGVQIP